MTNDMVRNSKNQITAFRESRNSFKNSNGTFNTGNFNLSGSNPIGKTNSHIKNNHSSLMYSISKTSKIEKAIDVTGTGSNLMKDDSMPTGTILNESSSQPFPLDDLKVVSN